MLPPPQAEVLPGVQWGRGDEFLSPAYWAVQGRLEDDAPADVNSTAATLWDQIAFCLLGGHGVTYEMNDAAYRHVAHSGVFDGSTPDAAEVEELLCQPLEIGNRSARYRFPRAKAGVLCGAHAHLMAETPPTESRALRNWLLAIKGIGPKTASWIVRNHLASDDVAILDIHVLRAGRLVGLFTAADRVQRHYFPMEDRFLDFARNLGVKASRLDIIMWRQMRNAPTAVSAACARQGIPFGD